jgi:hypothetical protein
VTCTVPPIPHPYKLTIALYSPSGERVRLLYDGASTGAADGFTVVGGLYDPIQIQLPVQLADGSTALIWQRDNDGGQAVASGTYVLKIESTDPFGSVTALTKSIQVLAAPGEAQLVLYNAAGEAVRHLDAKALGLDPVDLGGRLDSTGFELKERDGSLAWLPFDGLNDSGQPLQGGSYQLLLSWSDASGRHTDSRGLVIVPAPGADFLASAGFAQNPVPAGAEAQIRYSPCTCQVHATVHDLAGQLVAQGVDPGTGVLPLPLLRSASGIYLVTLEVEGSGVRVQRRTLKLALIR